MCSPAGRYADHVHRPAGPLGRGRGRGRAADGPMPGKVVSFAVKAGDADQGPAPGRDGGHEDGHTIAAPPMAWCRNCSTRPATR